MDASSGSVSDDGGMEARNKQLVLLAATVVFSFVALTLSIVDADQAFSAGAYAVVLGACAACAALSVPRYTSLAAGSVLAARALLAWQFGYMIVLGPAAWLGLYTLARQGDRRRSLLVSGAMALVAAAVVAALDDDPFFVELVGEAALLALPIAVADSTRSRDEKVRSLVDSAVDARVQAERLRIARDLHDVVAHGLSVISVQSGVAAYLIERDPAAAQQSLDIINTTGKKSLEELRAMVGVLRSTDEVPLSPMPTDPNDLDELLLGASNAGTPVQVSVSGEFPDHTTDACIVAVHRIVQEALTNVARHAAGSATTLDLSHGEECVQVRISNSFGSARAAVDERSRVPSTGVGLVGMKERASALGGTLQAGPTQSGEFEVLARLPYSRGGSE